MKLLKDRLNAHRVQDKRKGRDYSNNMTFAQFQQKLQEQEGKCFWTGKQMTVGETGAAEVSIDRIDCSLGHTVDNTILVCASLNFSRGNKSILQFAQYLRLLGLLSADNLQQLQEYELQN